MHDISTNLQNVEWNETGMFGVRAPEVEVSGSQEENKTDFENMAFKHMDCKSTFILKTLRGEGTGKQYLINRYHH